MSTVHERIFRLDAVHRGEVDWPESVEVESSWLAAPFLDKLPSDTLVVHQVRRPLDVLRSLERIRLFAEHGPYRDFAERHMTRRGDRAGLSSLELGLRYWDEWNALVEEGAAALGLAYVRLRLEELDAARVETLLAELGRPRLPSQVRRALSEVSPRTNTRGDTSRDEELAWDSLPAGELRDAVEARAARYGYASAG